MIQVKCIQKIRNKHNKIVGYTIATDDNTSILDVKAESLKQAIKNNKICVTNLTLTNDGRLVDASDKSRQATLDAKALINKAATMGFVPNKYKSACGHEYYVLENADIKTVWLVIPDNVTVIDDCKGFLFKPFDDFYFNTITCDTLKVIGGSGLITTKCLFMNCNAKHLDLSRFDTINVVDMSWTFAKCRCNTIDFSGYKTHKAENMNAMFYECRAGSLDLRSFNTSNVKDMTLMFAHCQAKYIDLSSFDISNVHYTRDIFHLCMAKISITSKKLAELYNNK